MFILFFSTLLLLVASDYAPKYQTIIQSTFPITRPIKIAGSDDVLWPLIPISQDQIIYDNYRRLNLIKISKVPVEETHDSPDGSNHGAHPTNLNLPHADHLLLSEFNDLNSGTKTNNFQVPFPVHEPDVTFLRPTYLFLPRDQEAPSVKNPTSSFKKVGVDDFRSSPFKKIVANALGAIQDPITKFTFPATNYGVPILSTKYALPKLNATNKHKPAEFNLPIASATESFREPQVKFRRPQFVFDEQEKHQYGLPEIEARFSFKEKESTKFIGEKSIDGVVYGLPYFRPGFFKDGNEWSRPVSRFGGDTTGKSESDFGVPVLKVPKTSYDVPIF